jgi:hypothetical protein
MVDGNHMSGKTTVYLDEAAYARLKRIARRRGVPAAALVREAVADYADRHDDGPAPRSVAGFSSGRRNLGERAESLLRGMGRPRRGSSPTRVQSSR